MKNFTVQFSADGSGFEFDSYSGTCFSFYHKRYVSVRKMKHPLTGKRAWLCFNEFDKPMAFVDNNAVVTMLYSQVGWSRVTRIAN
jgi:hypothetical protein